MRYLLIYTTNIENKFDKKKSSERTLSNIFDFKVSNSRLEFALPDDDCVPAEAFKTLNVACVAFLVAPDFLRPEVMVGLRDGGVAA